MTCFCSRKRRAERVAVGRTGKRSQECLRKRFRRKRRQSCRSWIWARARRFRRKVKTGFDIRSKSSFRFGKARLQRFVFELFKKGLKLMIDGAKVSVRMPAHEKEIGAWWSEDSSSAVSTRWNGNLLGLNNSRLASATENRLIDRFFFIPVL